MIFPPFLAHLMQRQGVRLHGEQAAAGREGSFGEAERW
jgi:hypothetical protein